MIAEFGDEGALDVQSVRIVKAIGDTGSITGAAETLGYSQPAVSQHVKRLERRLGMPVVERVGRRVRLTEAGRVLARHAPAVTTALEAAVGELAVLRGMGAATVRLAAFPSASPTVLPALLRALGQSHPGIKLTFVEAEPPEAVEAVREGRADLALTFSYPGDREDPHRESARGLSVHPVGTDPLMVVLPEGHVWAGEAIADLDALATEDWIAGCPRCRGHLLEACERSGFAPRITIETDNFVAVEGLVAQGIGVATLPRMAVESLPVLPGVAVVPLPAGESRTLHVVMAQGAERVPAVQAVVRAIVQVLRARDDPGPGAGGQ